MIKKNNYDQQLWDYHQTTNVNNLIQGHPRQNFIFRFIYQKIRPHSKVLEIGFGDGYLLKKLSLNYQCFGADISPKNIEQVKTKITNVKLDLIDTDGKLPYQDNFFDAFISSEVLEHMNNEELSKTATEIHRILKPNGIGIITVPANENLNDNLCFCPQCRNVFHKWGHKQSYNKEKLERLFSNFSAIKINKIINIPYKPNVVENVKYHIRKILVKFYPNCFIGTFVIFIKK